MAAWTGGDRLLRKRRAGGLRSVRRPVLAGADGHRVLISGLGGRRFGQ